MMKALLVPFLLLINLISSLPFGYLSYPASSSTILEHLYRQWDKERRNGKKSRVDADSSAESKNDEGYVDFERSGNQRNATLDNISPDSTISSNITTYQNRTYASDKTSASDTNNEGGDVEPWLAKSALYLEGGLAGALTGTAISSGALRCHVCEVASGLDDDDDATDLALYQPSSGSHHTEPSRNPYSAVYESVRNTEGSSTSASENESDVAGIFENELPFPQQDIAKSTESSVREGDASDTEMLDEGALVQQVIDEVKSVDEIAVAPEVALLA